MDWHDNKCQNTCLTHLLWFDLPRRWARTSSGSLEHTSLCRGRWCYSARRSAVPVCCPSLWSLRSYKFLQDVLSEMKSVTGLVPKKMNCAKIANAPTFELECRLLNQPPVTLGSHWPLNWMLASAKTNPALLGLWHWPAQTSETLRSAARLTGWGTRCYATRSGRHSACL